MRFIKINDTANKMLAVVNAYLQQKLGPAEVLKSLPVSDATMPVEEMKDEFVRQVRDQVHKHAVAELARSLHRMTSTKILCRRLAGRIKERRLKPQILHGGLQKHRDVKVLESAIRAVMACMSNAALLQHSALQQAGCNFIAIVARSRTFREAFNGGIIAANGPGSKSAVEICFTVWHAHKHNVEVLKSAVRALSVVTCSGSLIQQHVDSDGIELVLDTIAWSCDVDVLVSAILVTTLLAAEQALRCIRCTAAFYFSHYL